MKFEIIERSWFKRRSPTPNQPIPISVTVTDYKQEHDHLCKMHVTFDDDSKKDFISRVVYNELNDYWTIDGMHVAVKVIE